MYKLNILCSNKLLRFVILVTIIVLFATLAMLQSKDVYRIKIINDKKKYESEIGCYGDTDLESLEDISDVARPPENSMFFHETSCKSYAQRRLVLDARQACAVESAAFTNPNRSVYLLFTSPGLLRPELQQPSDSLLKALQSYNNVHILHANYRKYISGTAVEHLYTRGKIANSKYPLVHASDIMRYLTLYKFGGVYLDLDVVVMKSLNELGPNFSGMESRTIVAAGLMGLSSSQPGHDWATMCLEDLNKSYTGMSWSDSSVGVMTRLVQRLCNTTQVTVHNEIKDCQGFKVTPAKLLYPISYEIWPKLFDPRHTKETLKTVKDSYSIHLWNKLSHNVSVGIEPNYAYAKLANRFCPKVFAAVGGRMIP